MHLHFWQPIPSFHQQDFLNRLASAEWVDSVSLYFEAEVPETFKKGGWPVPVWRGVQARLIDPREKPVDASDCIHFFTGFQTHSKIWAAFHRLPQRAKRQSRVIAYAEAPALFDWLSPLRKIKYRINALRLRNQIDGVLAVGERGRRFYRSLLPAHVPVFSFAYYVDINPSSHPLDDRVSKDPGQSRETNFQANPPTDDPSADRDRVRFLYVGRLIRLKGLDRLFESLAKLKEGSPEWLLDLVGTGPEEVLLRRQAAQLGFAENLRWHGAVPYGDTGKFYEKADYLIQPSRGDGWGMTIPEALARGCEVIASQACGAVDLARAEFILPRDRSGWSDVLQRALGTGPMTTESRRLNRERVNDWGSEAGVRRLEAILRDL